MHFGRYEAPIDTAHQLAARNMEWGATQDAWTYSIRLASQVNIIWLGNFVVAQHYAWGW